MQFNVWTKFGVVKRKLPKEVFNAITILAPKSPQAPECNIDTMVLLALNSIQMPINVTIFWHMNKIAIPINTMGKQHFFQLLGCLLPALLPHITRRARDYA